MDFGEFSDVSLDTTDTNDFKSCDNSISDVETSSVWPNGVASLQCANNSTTNTTSNNNLNLNSVASRQADAFGITSKLTAQSLQKNSSLGRHQSLAGEDVFSERRRRLSSPSSPPQVPLSHQITSNSPEPNDIDYSKYDDFGSSEGEANVKMNSLGEIIKINDLDAVRQSEVKPHPRQIYERAKSVGCPEQQYSDEDEQAEIRRRRFGSECESEASAASSAWTETGSDENRARFIKPDLAKQASRASLDELLFDLYDGQGVARHTSVTSIDGSSTDCSSFSEYPQKSDTERAHQSISALKEKDMMELKEIAFDLANKINQKNTQLVKCLRNRERHRIKESKHCDMVTAILQAWSSKTRSDAKMKFSIEPIAGEETFTQWKDAVSALIRRPIGIPHHLRGKVWLSLASEYVKSLHLDWNKVVSFAFNDKCNPDDDALGAQIVKDLHRTGCSTFNGTGNDDDRVILQRVLLGYARWNKVTGYCQGFNILAAFILNITNKNEVDALKVMVYIVDHMLPKEYFAHNLRALTVDMAVFRSYLGMKLPKLSAHLTKLQTEARDSSTGVNVEPPLTNVFTMQWFLTMFATCLPVDSVTKIWDCVMVDGSEILIRTALAIWTKLAKRVIRVKSADEFYMTMGTLTRELLQGKIITTDELIHSIYNMAPIPLPKLAELREKYMYDITPFSAAMNSASHKAAYSEGEETGDQYINELTNKGGDSVSKTYHTLDLNLLKKQYTKLAQRQKQARLLMKAPKTSNSSQVIPSNTAPIAMNHLFVGKQLSDKKTVCYNNAQRHRSAMTRSQSLEYSVKATTPSLSDELSTRLDLYATAQQDSRQTLRYKMKRGKPVVASAVSHVSAASAGRDDKLDAEIREGLEKNNFICHSSTSSSHEQDAQEEADETLNTSTQSDDGLEECGDITCEKTGLALSRKISTVSNASCVTSDSVFLHDSPQTQSPASSSHSTPNHTPNHTPRRSHNLTTAVQYNNQSHRTASTMPRYSATTLMDTITSARKPFNPFPKPANGLLSAEKAKIGVKLGLYKPQDAMAYMSPTERRQFLKDRKDSYYGRVATPSRSSLW